MRAVGVPPNDHNGGTMYDFILKHGFLILFLTATVAVFIVAIRGDRD